MDIVIQPGQRTGSVRVPSSKSQAHRALILAALGSKPSSILIDGISKDIEATIACLNAIGADIKVREGRMLVTPVKRCCSGRRLLSCGESGSTLRFMLPIVGALGVEAEFLPKGRLMERPLFPLDQCLRRHGMIIEKTADRILCSGKLSAGEYELPGNISSQYISGLIMALPIIDGDSTLRVTGEVQSENYIRMTEDAVLCSGMRFTKEGNTYKIPGGQTPQFPSEFSVEGDYSSASFFLCMGALSERGVTVFGLDPNSSQGDKAVIDILSRFGAIVSYSDSGITVKRGSLTGLTIDAAQIPDIIPPLCAVAAVAEGETKVINAGRLRIKESDRLKTTAQMLTALGADVTELQDGLVIRGKPELEGGEVDSSNDHRIAMSAAVTACRCSGNVTVMGSECVAKSYPRFWDDLTLLEMI